MFRKSLGVFIITAILLTGAISAVSAREPTRIPTNRAALANVFQDDKGFNVWRYNTTTKQGEFQFQIDYDTIKKAQKLIKEKGETILLDSSGDIEIWALPKERCQVNSPMVDGMDYTFAFDC